MTREYNITPKPTKYKRILYRSRLEARWAVFFTVLRVSFEYEQYVFKTTEGGYMPDFFIEKTGWFIEIKPTKPTVEEIRKAQSVSRQGNKIVILWWDDTGNKLQTMFFVLNEVIKYEPVYQLRSPYWQKRPKWILYNLVWLKEITGKKNFDRALKIAKEYDFEG